MRGLGYPNANLPLQELQNERDHDRATHGTGKDAAP